MFHALNGARLIAYESFGGRKDTFMIWSVIGVLVSYAGVLAWVMLTGLEVGTSVFWLCIAILSFISLCIVAGKIWNTRNQLMWKLQRISAAFLFPMVAGHMLFMHMNYKAGHDFATIIARMSNPYIKVMDIIFLLFLLFHAGYGLYTIVTDTIKNKEKRLVLKQCGCLFMALLAFFGIILILLV